MNEIGVERNLEGMEDGGDKMVRTKKKIIIIKDRQTRK